MSKNIRKNPEKIPKNWSKVRQKSANKPSKTRLNIAKNAPKWTE